MGCVHPSAKVYVLESTSALEESQLVSQHVRLTVPPTLYHELGSRPRSSRSSSRSENAVPVSARVPMLALDRMTTTSSHGSGSIKPLSSRRSPRTETPRSHRSPRESSQASHRSPREDMRLVTARSTSKFPWLVKQFNIPPGAMDIGMFEMHRVIGAGLMGVICQAKMKGTSPKLFVAIKGISKRYIMHHKDLRHVEREKHALVALNAGDGPGSAFIVRMFGTAQDLEYVYFIMEYLPGGDLFRRLRQKTKFTSEVAKFYACEVFLALEHIASHGFAYRDLKPENIIIDEEGHCKLVDFGFTTPIAPDGVMHTFCGTPAYLSPEQLDRKFTNGYTKACDWWSFGVLVYEMLTGRTPFCKADSETPYSIYLRILRGQISLPWSLDAEAKELLRGCLNPNMARRLCTPEAIKRTAWLATDWDAVAAKKLIPPFVPQVESATDLRFFDDFKDFDSFEVALQKQAGSAFFECETVDQSLFKDF